LQYAFQKTLRVGFSYGRFEFSRQNVERLLHHLKTDTGVVRFKRLHNQAFGGGALVIVDFVTESNKSVAVEKINAHSSRLG
jgi:hypothetical protein